jgi:hypothetical protein
VPVATPAPAQPAAVRTPQRLQVTAGAPGTFGDVELAAVDRPRNVTELAAAAQPVTPEPWPAGSFVPVGTRGKRAHWTGTEWKGGASPGYPAPANRSEPEQSADRSGDPDQ